jgi:hypothetical protein
MRTTVTIDADVESMLNRLMKQKRLGFKEALNSALRAGLMKALPGKAPELKPLPVFDMGLRSDIDLSRALRLSAEIEDEETLRKLQAGK